MGTTAKKITESLRRDLKGFVISAAVASATVMGTTLPERADAAVVTFHFTGRLTVADPYGYVIGGGADGYTPITAELTLDTDFTGGGLDAGALIGSSTLSVTVTDDFFGAPVVFHDLTLTYGGSGVIGNMLVDWNDNYDMPMQVDWDVAGLATAIAYGLQVGDTISGDVLKRDTDGDGVGDSVVVSSLGSATPYADTLNYDAFPDFQKQGPAPMAATKFSLGLTEGPFVGVRGYIDIGSGNSMTVTSISSVPVPGAVWLFGSGLACFAAAFRKGGRSAASEA